jgi:hypothetical protein
MKETKLRELFETCPDVTVRSISFGEGKAAEEVVLTYCTLLCDVQRIESTVLLRLQQVFQKRTNSQDQGQLLQQLLSVETMQAEEESLIQEIFAGNLVLLFKGTGRLYLVPLSKRPNRNVEETNAEVSILGPRDGFIEDLEVNLGLIRKRLRTPTLTYEKYVVGRRSQTSVALLWMTDITNDEMVQTLRDLIQPIDLDILTGTAELAKILSGGTFQFLPIFVYSGRPDFATQALMKGRVVILIDGDPICLITPVELTFLLASAEDTRYVPVYVMAERFIRLIGIFIALFLPGFWNALTVFHQDQLPFRLLATLTITRSGVPMPASLETFMMLFVFEMFREAGARLPKVVGQTLSVVGGLIIGDAAIRAGLTSPGLVVVVASSVVATSTLVHHSLVGTSSIIRLFILLVSAILGMYGVMLCFIGVILFTVNKNFLGVHYLESINFQKPREMFAALLYQPFQKMRKRPSVLRTKDDVTGGESE